MLVSSCFHVLALDETDYLEQNLTKSFDAMLSSELSIDINVFRLFSIARSYS